MTLAISSHFDKNTYWFQEEKFLYYDLLDSFVTQYGEITHRTCSGIELKNDNPHIHIHYLIKKNKKKLPSSLAQTLKYHLGKSLKEKIPPKSYSIKYTPANKLKTSKDGFLRYVLKEVPDFSRCLGIPEKELIIMAAQAQEQYKLKTAEKSKKEEKKANEEKAWLKMCEYMDEHNYEYITHYDQYESRVHACIESIIQYKIDHCDGKGLCHTIKGQALRYLAKRGFLDKHEIYGILFSR